MTEFYFTGNDLIEMGMKPGAHFKPLLAELNMAMEANRNAPEAETDTLFAAIIEKHKPVPVQYIPIQDSVPYETFIIPENEAEEANAQSVFATMHEVMKTPTVVRGAVMPDACPAGPIGTIPVGGVVTTRNAIHPGMHSADVCCSLMVTELGDIDPKVALDTAHGLSHFGAGGHKVPVEQLPKALEGRIQANRFYTKANDKALKLARHHLRTVGASNHFVFVGRSEKTGQVFLVTHHGSRGFGADLFDNGMKVAEEYRSKHSPETLKQNAWIPLDTQEGADYMEGLSIAHDWTYLNHTSLHDAVLRSMGLSGGKRLFSPHNFVFVDHTDPSLIHHAKGATPVDNRLLALPQDNMVIPMNMAEPVLLVTPGATNRTGFAPHGAGRTMTRTQFRKANAHLTEGDLLARETIGIDARFYCGTPDTSELPSAYKSAASVQRDMAHFDLAKVVDRIQPFGCVMAGDVDRNAPWKKKAAAKKAAKGSTS